MALLQKEHSQNLAGIGDGMGKWLSAYKSSNISDTGKIGPRLPLRTNRKSHTCFRSVPKSTTLSDLEGSLCTFSKHMQEKLYIARFPCNNTVFISARQHIAYMFSALHAIASPSVCPFVSPSVTRVDHTKTVEVRIIFTIR